MATALVPSATCSGQGTSQNQCNEASKMPSVNPRALGDQEDGSHHGSVHSFQPLLPISSHMPFGNPQKAASKKGR